MRFKALLGVLATAGLVAALPAQRTWIVDYTNAPGTHFTDVPPAVQAASPGDTISIRTGFGYTAPTIDKGIFIFSVGNATLFGITRIVGIPAGESIVLQGCRFESLICTNVQGRLIMEGIRCEALVVASPGDVEITDCPNVVIRDSNIIGIPDPVEFTRSRVRLERSVVVSGYWPLPPPQFVVQGNEGAIITDSVVVASGTDIHGKGGRGGSGFNCSGGTSPRVGAVLMNSLVLLGDGSNLTGGYYSSSYPCGSFSGCTGSSVSGTGVVVVDPTSSIQCQVTTPPSITVRRAIVWVTTTMPARFGTTTDVEVVGEPGSLAVLGVSYAPATPTPLGTGILWLHPGSFRVLRVGNLDPQGRMTHNLPLRPELAPGSVLAFQAGLVASTGRLVLSAPSMATVLP